MTARNPGAVRRVPLPSAARGELDGAATAALEREPSAGSCQDAGAVAHSETSSPLSSAYAKLPEERASDEPPSRGRSPTSKGQAAVRRRRSMAEALVEATAVGGRSEAIARSSQDNEATQALDCRRLQLADAVLEVVSDLLVEIVREEEGRD